MLCLTRICRWACNTYIAHTHTHSKMRLTQEVKSETVKGRAWLNWAVFLPCWSKMIVVVVLWASTHWSISLISEGQWDSYKVMRTSWCVVLHMNAMKSVDIIKISLNHSLKTHTQTATHTVPQNLLILKAVVFSAFLNLVTANWSFTIRSDYIH